MLGEPTDLGTNGVGVCLREGSGGILPSKRDFPPVDEDGAISMICALRVHGLFRNTASGLGPSMF